MPGTGIGKSAEATHHDLPDRCFDQPRVADVGVPVKKTAGRIPEPRGEQRLQRNVGRRQSSVGAKLRYMTRSARFVTASLAGAMPAAARVL